MRVVLLIRKNKEPKKTIHHEIMEACVLYGIELIIQPYNHWNPIETDILIQWGYKHFQKKQALEYKKFNKNMKSVFIDRGWTDRNNTIMFYDYKNNRIPLRRRHKIKLKSLKKDIKHDRKVWIIMTQVLKDANLYKCKNYSLWVDQVYDKLKRYTDYQIIVREHPEQRERFLSNRYIFSDRNLEEDFERAMGIITWNSSAAIKAMHYNIPVCIYDIPELSGLIPEKLERNWVRKVEKEAINVNYRSILKIILSNQIEYGHIPKIDFRKIAEIIDG